MAISENKYLHWPWSGEWGDGICAFEKWSWDHVDNFHEPAYFDDIDEANTVCQLG